MVHMKEKEKTKQTKNTGHTPHVLHGDKQKQQQIKHIYIYIYIYIYWTLLKKFKKKENYEIKKIKYSASITVTE